MKSPLVVLVNILVVLLLGCKSRNVQLPLEKNSEEVDRNLLIEKFERSFAGRDEPPSMLDIISAVFSIEDPELEALDSMQVDSYGEGGYSFFNFKNSEARLGGYSGVIIGIYSNVNENAEFYEREAVSVEVLKGEQNWVFKWSDEKKAYINKK